MRHTTKGFSKVLAWTEVIQQLCFLLSVVFGRNTIGLQFLHLAFGKRIGH